MFVLAFGKTFEDHKFPTEFHGVSKMYAWNDVSEIMHKIFEMSEMNKWLSDWVSEWVTDWLNGEEGWRIEAKHF